MKSLSRKSELAVAIARYLVAPNQNEAELTIRKQIAQLVQLNEGQPHTYDRAALVKMLDEALMGSRPKTH